MTGNKATEISQSYRSLWEIITANLNMKAHIKGKKRSINGIIKTHLLPPSDKVLKKPKEMLC